MSEYFEKRTIDLGEFGQVVIDPGKLEFNEGTLSRYLEQEAGWYDYYGAKQADAEYLAAKAEEEFELKFHSIMKIEKSEKSSDKLAEARAKTDVDVAAAYQRMIEAKYKAKLLQLHLRSWDRNHDNVQNRGHTLRKEMDRLSPVIYGPSNATNTGTDSSEAEVEKIIKTADRQNFDQLSG